MPGIYWHFVDVMWIIVYPRSTSSSAVLNPLRSEAEAFRFLIYVLVTAVVIAALVLLVRAVF